MQIKSSHLLLGLALATTAALAIGNPGGAVARELVPYLRAPSAGNPRFLQTPSAQLGSPKVIVSWAEVGLGSFDTIHYVATATAGARYQCVNRGSNCPVASNKEDVMANVSVGGTFSVDKNGRISSILIIPAPPATLVCPGNQVVGVVSAVFTNITLTDTTNGVSSLTNPSALSFNGPECP